MKYESHAQKMKNRKQNIFHNRLPPSLPVKSSHGFIIINESINKDRTEQPVEPISIWYKYAIPSIPKINQKKKKEKIYR